MNDPMNALQALHDMFIAKMPEGASHEADDCPVCTGELSEIEGGSVNTYTEEEVQELRTQISDLEAKVKEHAESSRESEFQAKIDEAKTELEAKVAELQSQLDTAVLENENAKQERDNLLAWLEEQKNAVEEAAALAARRDERIAKVREVASFPDEHIEKNADRWAKLSDEDFEAALEDWRTVSAKKNEGLPTASALTASREGNSDDKGSSVMRDVMRMRSLGVDPRKL